MMRYVIVVDVDTLGDCVVEMLLGEGVPQSDERDHWDSQVNS